MHLNQLAFALSFAHRARCAAAIRFRPAAEVVRVLVAFVFATDTLVGPLLRFALAHRRRWASTIFARPATESLRRTVLVFILPRVEPNAERAAEMPRICLLNRSCSVFKIRTTPSNWVMSSFRFRYWIRIGWGAASTAYFFSNDRKNTTNARQLTAARLWIS